MRHVDPIAAVAAGLALTLPHAASAATTNIALSISGCEAAAVQADRLFDLARTELAPRSVTPSDVWQHDEALRLSVRLCQGSANGVIIELQNAGGAIALRQLDLSDVVGDLRARTLAVALAELLASASVEANLGHRNTNTDPALKAVPAGTAQRTQSVETPVAHAPPVSEQTPPLAPETAPVAAAPSLASTPPAEPPPSANMGANSLRATAGVALREFFAPNTTLIGPWLAMAIWRIAGEAQFLTSKQNADLGNVTLGTVTLYDANLAAAYRIVSFGSPIATSANLRAEVGRTWAQGNPDDNSKVKESPVSRTHFGLAIDLAVDAPITRHTSARRG